MPPPTRLKAATTPGHPTDIRIGICRGMGLSREDTAAMAGCSVPTVDLRKNEPVALEWEDWTRRISTTFVVGVKQRLEKQMETRLGKALDVIDRAVEHDDLRLALLGADRVMDRAVGKATQKVETTSDVTERHVFELPATTLEILQQLTSASQSRRIAAATIIDVTPTDDVEEGSTNAQNSEQETQ